MRKHITHSEETIMWTFTVYFTKHVSGLTMRYGIYNSFYEASQALTNAKAINSSDEWFIDERYTKE